jgi:PPIC-type PPIASE domain
MIAIDLLAATLSVGFACPSEQQPNTSTQGGEVVATFVVGGRNRTLSRDDCALQLARRHRNSQGGKQTIEHLVEVLLVKQAAMEAGLMPTAEEVHAEIRTHEAKLRQRKMDLDTYLARGRMTRADFAAHAALGMAQMRLVSKILKVPPEKVTPQHTALWTREARNKAHVEMDPTKLSPGVLARVGKHGEVTSLDVGRVLFMKVSKGMLRETVNRMVFEQCIAYESSRLDIKLTKVDLEKQFARRVKRFESDPRNQGVKYEQWLQAFGSDKKRELESRSLRTTLLHGKLVERRHPDAFLDKRFAANKEAMLRRHGARRAISVIFIRATDKPNKILRRDFPAARKHLDEIRTAIIDKKRSFATMAKIATDDPAAKQKGGRLGWQHGEYTKGNRDQRAPTEVLKAAFAMNVGDISQPIKTERGYYLVWLSGIEPVPEASVIRKRMLGEMAERYNLELYENAKVEYKVE